MDIQRMVESRIRELEERREAAPASGGGGDEPRAGERRLPERGSADIEDFILSADEKLAEVAVRVLELTERLSGDLGRMEQELLRSRLEVLQGAETVMDLAMMLRRRCREFLAEGGGAAMGIEEPVTPPGGRHRGVADLFRRT